MPVMLVVIILAFAFFNKKIPEGVPNDYFDRINIINDSHVNVYLYSDVIDFNDDYQYVKILNWEDLNHSSISSLNVLVLDMNTNIHNELATEEQIEELYEMHKFTIIIVNYASSDSSQFDHLIDAVDLESDLIIFSYDVNHIGYSGSISGEFPTNQMLMYAILDNIAYIIEENKT